MKRLSIAVLLILLLPVVAWADLTVSYIDVGQGDAALVQCDGHNMLVDAGTNASTERLLSYLDGIGATSYDLVVGTHPHEDHIGGLDKVVEQFDVANVWMPRVQADTRTFEDVLLAIKAKGLRITSPAPRDTFELGGATVTALAPIGSSYAETNDYSIVLRIDYGGTSFLFTGDAEETSENEMLAAGAHLKADVLKVGHHGSRSSTTDMFLDTTDPGYAVISCGADNSYGHPHAETLQKLDAKGIRILRTDKLGTITIRSDGKDVFLNSSERDNTPDNIDSGITYIGNKNSKKFHLPSCGSLPAEKNQVYFDARDDAINAGYDPCKKCKP